MMMIDCRLAACALAALAVSACGQPSSDGDAVPTEPVSVQTPAPRRLLRTAPATPYPEAASVRLFVRGDFDGSEEYLEADGRALSRAQRAALEGTLKIVSYDRPPDAVAACFVPHHFIRYFDKRGRQIGEISVCLCCHGVRARPDVTGPAPAGVGDHYLDFDEPAFRRIITEMGLPTDVNC